MIQVTTATRFRLSAPQMSIIWPGLDFLTKSFIVRTSKGSSPHAYPFRMYQLPSAFNRGTFNNSLMARIVSLWKRLNPRAKSGGRVAMNSIELRATIFAVRVHVDFVRGQMHFPRKPSSESNAQLPVDKESFDRLRVRSKRVILTLERHLKRANRTFPKSIPRSLFAMEIRDWRSHLRWMRLHIAYFKPVRPMVFGQKTRQQKILDELMRMAEHGIRIEGYQSPGAEELRRMMRMYVSSARRGREGLFDIGYVLHQKPDFNAKLHLGNFVIKRLKLKEISKS